MASGAARLSILGAILAGGESRRFGSDKAAATLDGKALLDHVAAAIGPQVDNLIVVGRDWPGLRSVPDRPVPGLGPLGGLVGAFAAAQAMGHDAVLCVGCDVLGLPPDLLARLTPGPACVETLPVVGLWPLSLVELLATYLGEGERAVYGWADRAQARRVALPGLRNINRPADLLRT